MGNSAFWEILQIAVYRGIFIGKDNIANDKIFWRLLFADPHGANFSLRMCEAL
jgi:hypothetical protein